LLHAGTPQQLVQSTGASGLADAFLSLTDGGE
jgi:hypothetical protein